MTEVLRPKNAAEAVANGAQLLDERAPGWWRDIDMTELDISSCASCVCGQLAYAKYADTRPGFSFGTSTGEDSEARYLTYLEEVLRFEENWNRETQSHGFCATTGISYSQLDLEWAKAIAARLEADLLALTPVEEKELVTA